MRVHDTLGENAMYVRPLGLLIAFVTFVTASSSAQAACSADTVASADAGRWTTGQLSVNKAVTLATVTGMRCSAAGPVRGAGIEVTATIRSANGFELSQAGGDAHIGYVASADGDGAHPVAQGGSLDFAAAFSRDLPALGAPRDVPMPISFRASSGVRLPPGRYTDVLTIEWRWATCDDFDTSGSICRSRSSGTATTTFSLSMDVDARPPIATMKAKSTLGAVQADGFRAYEAPRRIITVTVMNPDVVAIDPDSIVLDIPIDRQMVIADDGEGQPRAIEVVRGAEDGMRVSYGGLRDATDDVECTSDGRDWTLRPTDPSQVRSIRIRVRGMLHPGKSVVVALTGAPVGH